MYNPILIHFPIKRYPSEVRDAAFNMHNIVSVVEFTDNETQLYTTHSEKPFMVSLPYSEVLRQCNEVLSRASYPVTTTDRFIRCVCNGAYSQSEESRLGVEQYEFNE